MTLKEKTRIIVKHKLFEFFILILIVLYTLMIFVTFAVEDEAKKNTNLKKILEDLIIAEIVILSIFVLEILLKSYAFGIKVELQLISEIL